MLDGNKSHDHRTFGLQSIRTARDCLIAALRQAAPLTSPRDGPRQVLLMDEISTGLDSSTTYQIVRSIGNVAHLREATVLMSLLQPPPETFDLFDDVMLLSDGAMGEVGAEHATKLPVPARNGYCRSYNHPAAGLVGPGRALNGRVRQEESVRLLLKCCCRQLCAGCKQLNAAIVGLQA